MQGNGPPVCSNNVNLPSPAGSLKKTSMKKAKWRKPS